MVKCAACGCESPDGAAWCELCKEPFDKPRKPADPGPIPPEFLALDQGGKIPELPGWVRHAAVAAAVGLAALGWLMGRSARQSAQMPAAQTPALPSQ